MSMPEPAMLPPNLPVPDDDGAAKHLRGTRVPAILLPTTSGDVVVGQPPGRTVLFCYPYLGHPDAAPLVPHWDLIPGARGCTSEACGFRDWHAEFAAMGVQVLGVSTEDPPYQRHTAERLVLPFPLVSDAQLRLARAWRLPTFEVAGHVLLKRLTMLLRDGVVKRVWYPVFPPDRHAAEVLDWLRQG
jgi:peroxiredoxin